MVLVERNHLGPLLHMYLRTGKGYSSGYLDSAMLARAAIKMADKLTTPLVCVPPHYLSCFMML